VAGNGDGALFKMVAIHTGSKNSLKGVGFILGAVLLSWLVYDNSLWAMAASSIMGACPSKRLAWAIPASAAAAAARTRAVRGTQPR
jgi:hypothetical protein